MLVVEDDFYLADDTRRALQDAGARVLGPCARIDDCLQLLGEEQPDCAIVDINLGRGPNFDIAAALRERGIPFVFLTGYDAGDIPAEFANSARLEKPVNTRRMLEIVDRLCVQSQRPI